MFCSSPHAFDAPYITYVNQAAPGSPCCLLFNSIDQTHVCTEACIMPGLTLQTWQHLEVSFGFHFFSLALCDPWF